MSQPGVFRTSCCPLDLDDGQPDRDKIGFARGGESAIAWCWLMGFLRDDLGELERAVRAHVTRLHGSGGSREAFEQTVALVCKRIRGR